MRCRSSLFLSATFCASILTTLAHSAPIPAASPDITAQWRLIGPFRGGWAEMIEGVPSRPDTFYFGAAGGGIWRTDDAGRTWRSLFDHGPTAPIGALAVAPSAPDTVYIGAGQPEPRYDVAGGTGVFKTLDGGKTWAPLGLEKTRHIGRILINPTNPDDVLVAAVGDFFKPGPDRGVFRTTDGGKTWTRALAIGDDVGAVDLAADPKDPNVVFAAAWQARQYPWQSYFTPVGGPGSAIYHSSDGGATWSVLGGKGWPTVPLGRISLATTRTAGALRIYAMVSGVGVDGLYRSDDGGASWIRANDNADVAGYYASRVTVDPADPDVVYLVGQSIRRCAAGGKTCSIFLGAPGGDDYHHVWINPARPDHMATASDQGVVVSVDAGKTWSSWYNQPTGQFYHLATDDRFPYRIYSGQQDSGTVGIASRGDFGAIDARDWRPVGGDERDYDIPDPDDANIVYGSGLGGHISRFDARTGESANITPFPLPNYGQRQTTTAHHFVWVTPLALSKVGPKTLYLGADVVFASTDEGSHWSVISPDLTGKVVGATPKANQCDGDVKIADAKPCGYGGVWTLAPSPRNAGELWVGTDDGLVQMTRDGGAHWSNVTPPKVPEWAKIAAIDVSPLADGAAYVVADNQRQGDLTPRVWATKDGGATWRDASGDLPRDHFVAVVRADPVRAGLLYAGTEVGVYVSHDDGVHWRPLQGNLPTAWVRDLVVHGDDLVAATQGRAIWALGDLALLRQVDPAIGRSPLHLFTPAPAMRVRANNNRDTPLPPGEPAGENPPAGAVIDYWLGAGAVKGPVTLEVRDASGALVQTLTSAPSRLPDAEQYFADRWIHPAAPLSTAPGLHRTEWNLRWARPSAIEYNYSIGTAAGTDTPITPEGPLALPGVYHLTLHAGAREDHADLAVKKDPRGVASDADLAASLALSQDLTVGLAKTRQGFGEMAIAHDQLVAAQGAAKTKPANDALASRIADLIRRATPPAERPNFQIDGGILAAIETDLEGADLAPTEPQHTVATQTLAEITTLWTAWTALRDHDLADLNADLARAGLKPVVIPAADQLVVKPARGGEDLP